MDTVKYVAFTPTEEKIHESAVSKILENIKNGLNFKEACAAVDVADAVLRKYVVDDALKVMIADLHYGGGMTLPQVAESLRVPLKAIAAAHLEMVEDAGIAAAKMSQMDADDALVGNA